MITAQQHSDPQGQGCQHHNPPYKNTVFVRRIRFLYSSLPGTIGQSFSLDLLQIAEGNSVRGNLWALQAKWNYLAMSAPKPATSTAQLLLCPSHANSKTHQHQEIQQHSSHWHTLQVHRSSLGVGPQQSILNLATNLSFLPMQYSSPY